MAKPWEAFQTQAAGPWTEFQSEKEGPWSQFQSTDQEEEEKQEPAPPEEPDRIKPKNVYGTGVLDLLLAPLFKPEQDPRLGAAARGAKLIGSGLEAAARISEIAPDTLTATAPAIEAVRGISPKLQEWADSFRNWGQEINYEPSTKLGDIAENPAKIIPFIIESVIQSSPDMAAAAVALPAYIPALANDILNQRLENDGRTIEQATVGDVAAAVAAAAIQGPLERFATRRLVEPKGVLGQTAFQAGTEAAQETAQYAAETAGTEVGFDPAQAGLVALEAAIVGGGLGATAATVSALETNAVRREIEKRFRQGEDVRSEEELVELDRIKDQALQDAQAITAPEIEADPLQFGSAYSEIIYDSIGQYIPINEEFKVEEKTIDDAPKFVVTDRSGIQYGQALENQEQASSLASGLNKTTQERASVLQELYPLQRSLSEMMKGYGLNDIGVSLDRRIFTRRGEALTSEGLFDPVTREVFLAVDAIDPNGTLDTNQRRKALRGVLRHEVVHALRYLDLWKKSEWKNLEKTVSKKIKPGTGETYLQVASKNYGDQSKVIQVEEAVADLIRDVADRQLDVSGKPRSLSERAIQFFDRAKNALTGSGFQTYEDIVRRVEKGIVGSRVRSRVRTLRATEEQMGYKGVTPDRIQAFFDNIREPAREQAPPDQAPAISEAEFGDVILNADRQAIGGKPIDTTQIIPESRVVPQSGEDQGEQDQDRQLSLTGPSSVTEPGPATDVDTTGAAEALNEGQPVNSLGIPIGPLLTYTMPDGTVAPRIRESRQEPIRRAKLAPVMKSLISGVEFIQSAPDKLRGGVGLEDIASRIENYYDTYDARLGEVNGIIREVTQGMSRSELRSSQETFERYMRAKETGNPQDANEIFNQASNNDRKFILAWNQVTEVTGRVNTEVRDPEGAAIQVYDSRLNKGKGGWRNIGTFRDFFPRTLRREVLEVMMNPDADPILYGQLLDSLIESGKANTREEADDFLNKDYFSDEIKSDYFAGVEKARTEALPEIFYDYSWDAATRYLSKWARRTSQIQYFGQDLGPIKKDWFDTNIKLIRSRETQEYLHQIRNIIYQVETFGVVNNMMRWGNQLATGLQLGNPASAFLNLVGGDIANIQMYGWKEVAKAHASLLLDWKKVQNEGTTLGILNKDYLRILQDGVERDAGKYFAADSKTSAALAKFANTTLTFSGFNGAENIVRATAMLAARGFLNSSLAAINNNPNSLKSKKFIDFVKRENLDLDELIAENGAGPETEKFMRRGVNVPQGSYRIDMTPVFIDTNVGRFFFKYQKFGTQINRFFYRNFLKPWLDDPTDIVKFLRLLSFLLPSIFGGEIINQFRRFLGYGGDYGPTYAQISKAFENGDTANAWGLIFSRAMQNVTVAGSLGFFGNYYQFGKDVMDQQRVKNPMNPPALSSIDALIDLGYRLADQGKLTARDLDEIAENTLSFYRANKRIALAGMSELGADGKEVKRFVAQRDVREIRRYGLRYAQDMEIEGTRQRSLSGPPVRTELTPVNKAIVDALYQGNSSQAKALMKQALKGKRFKEKQRIKQSIRASIRLRQPIQIGGSAPNREEKREFLKWAKRNLSQAEYQKIKTMDRQYTRAAARMDMGFKD